MTTVSAGYEADNAGGLVNSNSSSIVESSGQFILVLKPSYSESEFSPGTTWISKKGFDASIRLPIVLVVMFSSLKTGSLNFTVIFP